MEIVSFVILHFRDRNITDASVKSILQMEDQEQIRIVIVDNDINKTEEERRELSERYQDNSRIFVLPVYENGGFSYANNQGYRYSREKLKASYIIVLNNDVQFLQTDFLRLLKKSYGEHPCHVLGPDIICEKTRIHQNPMDVHIRTREEAEYTVHMNRLALKLYPIVYPIVSRELKRAEKQALQQRRKNGIFYQKRQEEKVLFGACLIFTPEFIKQEELAFAPETQFFYEEYILAYRCQKKGYHVVYDPALKVLHKNSSETNTAFKNKQKRLRFRLERTAEACEVYLKLLLEDHDAG